MCIQADDAPRKVYLELTAECNLDCAMCIRRSWQSAGGRMSAETFERVLGQLKDLPTLATVNLSGYGEPMTHPQFVEFLRRVKSAGLGAEAVTNGTLLDPAAAERIVDLKLDKLVVSLDSLTPQAGNLLHGGSFAAVAENLKALHQRKLMSRSPWPEVIIEFVASRSNIHELPELLRYARVLGFSAVLVTNLVPHAPELAGEVLYEHWSTTARGAAVSPYTPCVDLPRMDPIGPAEEVFDRLRRSGTRLRIDGVEVFGAGPQCPFVARGRFAVRFDGAVSPCLPLLYSHTLHFRDKTRHVRRYEVGNVNDRPLQEIWDDPEYRRFRDRVRRFEFSPCLDCSGCDLRETNEEDCSGDAFPRCGECLWAAGIVQCP